MPTDVDTHDEEGKAERLEEGHMSAPYLWLHCGGDIQYPRWAIWTPQFQTFKRVHEGGPKLDASANAPYCN